MGAVKEMAIELEIRQDEASQVTDAAIAYRLGLLEACRLITEENARYAFGPEAEALNQCWRSVFDAVTYLQEVSEAAS